jgi:hypothetical protein
LLTPVWWNLWDEVYVTRRSQLVNDLAKAQVVLPGLIGEDQGQMSVWNLALYLRHCPNKEFHTLGHARPAIVEIQEIIWANVAGIAQHVRSGALSRCKQFIDTIVDNPGFGFVHSFLQQIEARGMRDCHISVKGQDCLQRLYNSGRPGYQRVGSHQLPLVSQNFMAR